LPAAAGSQLLLRLYQRLLQILVLLLLLCQLFGGVPVGVLQGPYGGRRLVGVEAGLPGRGGLPALRALLKLLRCQRRSLCGGGQVLLQVHLPGYLLTSAGAIACLLLPLRQLVLHVLPAGIVQQVGRAGASLQLYQ